MRAHMVQRSGAPAVVTGIDHKAHCRYARLRTASHDFEVNFQVPLSFGHDVPVNVWQIDPPPTAPFRISISGKRRGSRAPVRRLVGWNSNSDARTPGTSFWMS